MFLSGKGTYFGILFNDFAGAKPIRAPGLRVGEMMEFMLETFHWRYYKDGNQCRTFKVTDPSKCYFDEVKNYLETTEDKEKCLPYQLQKMLDWGDIMTTCKTFKSHRKMVEKVIQLVTAAPCKKPCAVVEFKADTDLIDTRSKNLVAIKLRFRTMDVVINDEIPIYNFLDFIGNVGGSLGLFLGFSFNGFGTSLLYKFLKRFED